jgi:lipopolysaccharide transport system ATP-binding protein
MAGPAIRVENLGKRYFLKSGGASLTFREELSSLLRRRSRLERAEFWAVKDVSFELAPGESLGVIGPNGSGKSTLFKMLSRIVTPTRGRIEVSGRVGTLLEVGTGFHPELSGRENIYLNSAILGIPQSQVRKKFDEIVDFAGVDRFLDTPVKHYSSGMYVRLAFSVAAHLETEILLVDEVLAVGDFEFQKKCLARMEAIESEGRTLLFVSHSMEAIRRICKRAILLDGGRVAADGPSYEVCDLYLGRGERMSAVREWSAAEAPGDDVVRLRRVAVCDESDRPLRAFDVRTPIAVEIVYDLLQPGHHVSASFALHNEEALCVLSAGDFTRERVSAQDISFTGTRVSRCVIPANLLSEGLYTLHVAMIDVLDRGMVHATAGDIVMFHVSPAGEGEESSSRGIYTGPMGGLIRPLLPWETADRPLSS